MTKFKNNGSRLTEWLIAGALGLLAAILDFASLASYAYPGDSARLMAIWRGLDPGATDPSPLMSLFAKALGGGNLIAALSGVVAVVTLYHLVSFFVRERVRGEFTAHHDVALGRIAGVATCVVFMLTPAVREAATHVEPRLFDFAWALFSFACLIPFARKDMPHADPRTGRRSLDTAPLLMLVAGALAGLGFLDSPLVIALLPLSLAAVAVVAVKRGGKPYAPLTLYIAGFFVAFVLGVSLLDVDLVTFLKSSAAAFREYRETPGWLFIAIFATLPFVATIFSSYNAYNEKPGLVQWLYHGALTFASILAIATPLAPSALLEPYGILPVASSAFAAVVAGHLVSFWVLHRKKAIGLVVGGLLAFVLVVTCVWNLFSFDGSRGAFADKVAERILADLGERTWFVSDGTLDDHLRLAAERAQRPLELISLNRDLDEKYLMRLSETVRAKNVGGSKNAELVLSLSLGVLPFVQDWFAADPTVGKSVAIYGAPDLWYSAGIRPVPEFLFFGADPQRIPDWTAWKEFDALLKAPKGWGSYRARNVRNPVDRMRHSIRRHLGLVANDRGVWLQDEKHDDEAFAMYEMVNTQIDRDNVCALFNQIEMAGAKHPKALAKKHELERQLKAIVDDKERRYYIWRLGNYYGYIRNPDIFIRLGYTWARSGRPGDALSQIRRAIDFVPTDKRTVLLNMMAALYANDNDRRKSRRIYEQVLAKNSTDHDALIGMMRLELLDGNSAKALEYLEKAVAAGADTKRLNIERAMVAMMKSDFVSAREILRKATDATPGDMQAWSLLAAVTMQQCDAAKSDKEKARLTKELETVVLPAMEKNAKGQFDYYVQTTRAFILLRQGENKRREARDAFVVAAKSRPDVSTTQDLVLGLDISLDDTENAEQHARDMLRRNRNAPLANYVMGSLALRKSEYASAEAYLRKAADADRPVALALNDLAEVLRRKKSYDEAERYARRCIKIAPQLYVAWETLGSILLDADRKLDEAEESINKACELSRLKNGHESDIRMLVSLARVQLRRGDKARARGTVRKVEKRVSELNDFEKREFEQMRKGIR